MKKFYSLIILTIASFIFVSCATIFEGSNQNISISSMPDKADVKIKTLAGVEVYSGVTPATISLPKKHEYTVAIDLKGYKESTIQISQSLEGWFWGNLICGGVVGMIIDYASGAMWDLEPQSINISLVTAFNSNGIGCQTFAVLRTIDQDHQHRLLIIPLIKKIELVSAK